MMTRTFLKLVYVLSACVLFSGCSTPYIKNRGNDLADIFDIGLTVNGGAPQFRLDFQPFFLTAGYSDLHGKLIGLGGRKWGINDFESKGWGAVLTGKGVYGTGPFDPTDPRQYADPGNPTNAPKERPSYDMGLIPLATDGDVLWTKYAECNKGIHLGWIGIHVPCRPLDLVDFVLGFTTWDIMRDDAKSATDSRKTETP